MWPVDRCVLTDDDFAPPMVTDRPETVQLERPTAAGSAHSAKPATAKQTPGYTGYIPGETSRLQSSNPVERPRPKLRMKHCTTGEVLNGAPHKESLNRPNIV